MPTNPGLSPQIVSVAGDGPSPPESPDQLQGNWPGGGRFDRRVRAARPAPRPVCWGGGGGGGRRLGRLYRRRRGRWRLGGARSACIGATLSLREVSSAASSALSLFSSACASSSEALRTGVGSGGASGRRGGGGVFHGGDVQRRIDRRTGTQQPRRHEQQKKKQKSEQQGAEPGASSQCARAGRRVRWANIAAGPRWHRYRWRREGLLQAGGGPSAS